MSPNSPNPPNTALDALFAQSMGAFQKGDLTTALKVADELLHLSNGAGPAYVWGVRLRLEGRLWQEAIDLGHRGQDKSPGLCGLMGHAYEASGNLEQAQIHYARATVEQPENPGWWVSNASALSRLYRDFESMESLQQAVSRAQSPDPSALLILASQQLSFGYADRAVNSATRALAANPKLDGALPLLARSLMALGRFEDAEKRWNQAILMAPRDAGIPLQRAIALIRHGQFDAGVGSLRKLLDAQPNFVPALVQIATNKKITNEDLPLVNRMAELLSGSNLSDDDRIALSFALGKALDNLKEFERAIRHFDEGNRLQYRAIEQSGGFDQAGYTANMNLRMKVYDQETVKRTAVDGDPTISPIFVLGVIRSGTTLAEQILSSHPMVAGAGELDFWLSADLRLMDYESHKLNEAILRDAAQTYLRLLGGFAKNGESRVIDKQPGNLILAGALHIAYPNARIIHMHRNPVDTAVSIWSTNIRTSARFVNNKANIAYAFREHDRLMQHWREVIPADRFLDVSYESLITDREVTTRNMVEFCGLPWDDACLSPEKNDKVVLTPSLWQVRQPVYRTSMERWRNYEPWLAEFKKLMP